MTKLLYLQDFDATRCSAKIVGVEEFQGRDVVMLDQTCFYPKGGGQDFDTGSIQGPDGKFQVEEVYFIDGEVKHIGVFDGKLSQGDEVECSVDEERRRLNTKLHSAGHAIDMVLRKIRQQWRPVKASHLPSMLFVDYSGEYDPEEREELIEAINHELDLLVKKGTENTIKFLEPKAMEELGAVVQPGTPKDKPSRVMMYDDFAVPCGGTHVRDVSELVSVHIKKIKRKDGYIRLSYAVQST